MLHLPDAGVGRRAPVCYFRGAADEPSRGNRSADVAAGRSRAHAAEDPAWLRRHPPPPRREPASGSDSAPSRSSSPAWRRPRRSGPARLRSSWSAPSSPSRGCSRSCTACGGSARNPGARRRGAAASPSPWGSWCCRRRPWSAPASYSCWACSTWSTDFGSSARSGWDGAGVRRSAAPRWPPPATWARPPSSSCCGTAPPRPGSWPSPPPPASSARAGTWSPRPCTRIGDTYETFSEAMGLPDDPDVRAGRGAPPRRGAAAPTRRPGLDPRVPRHALRHPRGPHGGGLDPRRPPGTLRGGPGGRPHRAPRGLLRHRAGSSRPPPAHSTAPALGLEEARGREGLAAAVGRSVAPQLARVAAPPLDSRPPGPLLAAVRHRARPRGRRCRWSRCSSRPCRSGE